MAKAFGKAVLLGTLLGGGPVILLTLPLGLTGPNGFLGAIGGMLLPLLIAGAFVVPLSVFIGLPAHLVLRRLDILYLPALALVAAIIGFMAPWIVAWWAGVTIEAGLCLWGALVGMATAYKWASSLQRIY